MDIIQMLVKNLNISDEQAKGGAGLIFKLLKDQLDSGDFSKIADIVPGLSGIIDSSPKSSGGLMGAIGVLAGSLGGGDSKIGNLADLAGGFSKLGLDASMVNKFIPVIMSFVEEKGGSQLKGILTNILKI